MPGIKNLVTVVVCTYNRAQVLRKCLESLVNQSANKGEYNVLVVDNNSSDKTKDTTLEFINKLNIRYIKEHRIGLSIARNRGIKESRTEYVGFTDDDAAADRDWLQNSIGLIREKRPDIFGGSIFPIYYHKRPRWFLDAYETVYYGNHRRYLKDDEYLIGPNIFFRKKIFNKIGFFDELLGMQGGKVRLGEETRLQKIAKNLRIKILYDPNLVVYHLAPAEKTKISYILKRSFIFGRSSRHIFKFLNLGLITDLYYLVREIIKAIFLFVLLSFRDKIEAPYWQNYIIKIFRPVMERAGRVYSYCFK